MNVAPNVAPLVPALPESHRALLDAPVGVLATIGPDGFPQVTALWFLYDEDEGAVRFSLTTSRQKTKNLQANPVIGVHIQDAANPVRYLEVRGDARIEPDDDYAFAQRLGAKYGGADLRAMDAGQGRRFVVTVEPCKSSALQRALERIRTMKSLLEPPLDLQMLE